MGLENECLPGQEELSLIDEEERAGHV